MSNLIKIDGKPIEKLIQVVSQGIGIRATKLIGRFFYTNN